MPPAPDRGINAVYQAARVIVGLQLVAPQLAHDNFLGQGTLSVTEIGSRAGSRNAVPDGCSLVVDRRLSVGETEARALAEIRQVIGREGVRASASVPTYHAVSYTGRDCEARQHFPFWVTPRDEPLLLEAESAVRDALGYAPRVGRWEFSTDGVYTAGTAGIPTIGFGPGEERHAHTVDEQIRTQDIVAAARVYAALAARLLGGRDG